MALNKMRGRLDRDGAVVNVMVGASFDEDVYLSNEPLSFPGRFATTATTALIDTGASMTAVDPFVVKYLGIVQSGFTEVSVPGESGAVAKKVYPLYDIAIFLEEHPQQGRWVRAVGVLPATPGVSLLIGRDILDRSRFVYDGVLRRFVLWF